MTEAPLQGGEWQRIETLVEALSADPGLSWISPSDVLEHSAGPHAGHPLRLESADQPIPVKKQDKYNVLRWALTGRDDLSINSRCHRLHKTFIASSNATDADWQELCYLWGSDFRTHITQSRWAYFLQRLAALEAKWPAAVKALSQVLSVSSNKPGAAPASPKWSREGRWLTISTNHLQVRFNCRRGLAIDHFIDNRISLAPLFGTLHHGRFDDIAWGADYYSGHLVFQSPGSHKITDLIAVEPEIREHDSILTLKAAIPTPLGPIFKTWSVDSSTHSLHLHLQIAWPEASLGRLRIIPITLIPEAFANQGLFVLACNGGDHAEHFHLGDQATDHGKAVSFLVSAYQSLGLTDGTVVIGDESKSLQLRFNPADAALLGQIVHQPIDTTWITRLALSARELDDTAKTEGLGLDVRLEIIAVSAGNTLTVLSSAAQGGWRM
jgi:hypothetical protein